MISCWPRRIEIVWEACRAPSLVDCQALLCLTGAVPASLPAWLASHPPGAAASASIASASCSAARPPQEPADWGFSEGSAVSGYSPLLGSIAWEKPNILISSPELMRRSGCWLGYNGHTIALHDFGGKRGVRVRKHVWSKHQVLRLFKSHELASLTRASLLEREGNESVRWRSILLLRWALIASKIGWVPQ